jgi:hypothetical protein
MSKSAGNAKKRRVALQFVAAQNAGSLKVREGGIGGTEYTMQEMVLSLTTDLEESIGPKHSRGRRETENLLRRARAEGSKVEVVLHPRPGCRIRRKPPKVAINPFPLPSSVLPFAACLEAGESIAARSSASASGVLLPPQMQERSFVVLLPCPGCPNDRRRCIARRFRLTVPRHLWSRVVLLPRGQQHHQRLAQSCGCSS